MYRYMYIENLYRKWMTNGPKGAVYSVTDNGWMQTRIFTDYLRPRHLVLWRKDIGLYRRFFSKQHERHRPNCSGETKNV